MTLVLRHYQEQALSDLWTYFTRKTGNPLAVLPTGSGKSLVMAEWCRLVFDVDPNGRIIVVTHVRELVSQNYSELLTIWPDAPAGIYSAGLGRRDLGSRIIFCSIQSVYKKAFSIQQCDLVLVDEAHLIPRNADTMYRKFLTDLHAINPHLKIMGLTATPFRLDSGMLHEGENALFSDIAHETPVRMLIDEGWLCPPVTFNQAAQINTDGVGTRGGEFITAQLEFEALEPETVKAIADRVVAAGADRKGWLVFGVSVKHCTVLAEALRDRGIETATIFGDTEKRERDRIIAEFKAGRIRALSSMGVLTTGFNAKHVDLIALARPTKSTGLYIQMVGRGTRPLYASGFDLDSVEGRLEAIKAGPKPNCLVLDFGGNIRRHGPFDDPFIKKPQKKGEEPAPFKECPECGCCCGTATRYCPSCGYEFPPPVRVVEVIPEAKQILAPEPDWLEVDAIDYGIHHKGNDPANPPTLRVTYRCGLLEHREWACFSHSGYPRTKAEAWWLRRAGGAGVGGIPKGSHDAIARVGELAVPSHIKVRQQGKYTEVIGARFDEVAA